jgi:DNA ligase D-like protein (predicted 3'-phosphoesterase)
MEQKNKLASYKAKRTFTTTPEPPAKKKTRTTTKNPIFVIHKHAARNLHYDFRIEVGGVLKSWAIPKGISANPAQKRLAIPTEDHPYDYAKFEGVIPKGNYGGGTVMLWDKGTYRNLKTIPMDQCIKSGRIELLIKGKKLKGGYALIRTKLGDGNQWLFLKMNDEYANRHHKKFIDDDVSAKSGKSMKEIGEQK